MSNLAVKYHILENGEIVDLARAKISHNRLISRLLASIAKKISRPCEVFAEQSYRWEEDTAAYRMPDISIICNAKSKNGVDINNVPWFICEILSQSTKDSDRNEKMELYGRMGVAEYWLIEPDTKKAERYINENHKMVYYDEVLLSEEKVIKFVTKDIELDIENLFD